MIELLNVIYTLATLLFVVGVFYAWQIAMSPSPHGLTFVSVAVGDGFVDLALAGAIFVALIILFGLEGAMAGWWLCIFPFAAHLLAGIPMLVGQLWKLRNDRRRASDRLRGK